MGLVLKLRILEYISSCPIDFGASLKARQWTSILPGAVTFKNAFRARKPDAEGERVPLPQSFSYMLRSGGWTLLILIYYVFLYYIIYYLYRDFSMQ